MHDYSCEETLIQKSWDLKMTKTWIICALLPIVQINLTTSNF